MIFRSWPDVTLRPELLHTDADPTDWCAHASTRRTSRVGGFGQSSKRQSQAIASPLLWQRIALTNGALRGDRCRQQLGRHCPAGLRTPLDRRSGARWRDRPAADDPRWRSRQGRGRRSSAHGAEGSPPRHPPRRALPGQAFEWRRWACWSLCRVRHLVGSLPGNPELGAQSYFRTVGARRSSG
jgi:hypothetical protein